MLKGHAKIELTNINTKEVTTYEADNLVTNAISEILTNAMPYADAGSSEMGQFFPIYTNLTRGLLLFEHPIEENADNYAMPNFILNPLVGYANDSTTVTANKKRGVCISSETKALANGFQYVWSFDTTQGNGTFSEISLTSRWNGYLPYCRADLTCRSSGLGTTARGYNCIDYDFQTKSWLDMYTNGQTLYVKKKQIAYTTIPTGNAKLGDIITLDTQTYILTTTTISADAKWLDGGDGYIYCFDSKNSTTINVIRVDKTTFQEDTSYTRTLTLSDSCSLGKTYSNVIIIDGYFYIGLSSAIERFRLSDENPIGELIEVEDGGYDLDRNAPCLMPNNMLYWDDIMLDLNTLTPRPRTCIYTGGYHYGAFTDTNEFDWIVHATPSGIVDVLSTDNALYSAFTGAYLATINNLEAPITKTSEQTMRITYTLTEE